MIMVPRRYYESDAESLTERPSYNLPITNKNSRIFVLSEAYSGMTLDVPWVLGARMSYLSHSFMGIGLVGFEEAGSRSKDHPALVQS